MLEIKVKAAAWSRSEGHPPGLQQCLLTVCSRWRARELSGVSFIKALVPFHKGINHLLGASPPRTISLGIRFSACEFCGDTGIQSVVLCYPHAVTSSVLHRSQLLSHSSCVMTFSWCLWESSSIWSYVQYTVLFSGCSWPFLSPIISTSSFFSDFLFLLRVSNFFAYPFQYIFMHI